MAVSPASGGIEPCTVSSHSADIDDISAEDQRRSLNTIDGGAYVGDVPWRSGRSRSMVFTYVITAAPFSMDCPIDE